MRSEESIQPRVSRSITLPCGNKIDIEYNTSFEENIKEMYSSATLTDCMILDFFKPEPEETLTSFHD